MTSSGSLCSVKSVNSQMSEKKIVSSFLVPPPAADFLVICVEQEEVYALLTAALQAIQ